MKQITRSDVERAAREANARRVKLFLLCVVAVAALAGASAIVISLGRSAPQAARNAKPEPLVSGEQLATLRSALKRRIETHVSYAQLADMHAGAVGFVRDGEIVQILDDETCLASVTWGDYGQHQRVVILTGFPTCTHVDGDEIGFVPIKVIGRRTYQAAAGGPRTTWVLAWIAEVYDAAP